jgi:hypothetical protein
MPSPQTTPRIVPPPPIETIRGRPRRAQLAAADSATARLVPAASIVQGERRLRLRDVLTSVGLSRAHVYNLIKQQLFPRPSRGQQLRALGPVRGAGLGGLTASPRRV